MMKKYLIGGAAILMSAGVAYAVADYSLMREPVLFYAGHTHNLISGEAIDAPAHSGGLNRAGCHNGSVPYHCH